MADGPGGSNVVGKVSVRVVPNTSRFRRELKAKLERLNDSVRVAVEIDDKAAKERLQGLQRDLRNLSGQAARVDVAVNDAGAKQQFRRLLGELQSEAKATRIEVNTDIDAQAFKRAALSMDNMAQSAGGVTRGFAGIGRTGAIVGAVFAAAAPAVGLVVGLLSSLPATLSAFGAGIGAIALGVDGIKAAAEPLRPLFDELKASVASVFSAKLPPIFEQLKAVFPVISKGMQGVADGLVSMFQGVADSLASDTGLENIQTILRNTGTLMASLQPAMQQFTTTFLAASAAGSQAFGHLSTVIGNFANGFGAAIDRMIANGSFEAGIQGMSVAVDGFLTLFTRLFEVGGTAMAQLGGPLTTMFTGIGDLLVAAMPALTSFSAGVAETIGVLGSGLAPAFAALTPVVDAIMPVITQLAAVLGPVLSTAVAALAPAVTAIAQALGPVLTSAVTALAPIMTQLATTLGGVLLEAVTALAPIMPQLAQTFSLLAAAVGEGLAAVLPIIAQAFAAILPAVVQLIPPLLQIVEAFIPLIPAAAQVAAALAQLVVAASPLLNILAGIVAGVASVVAKVVEMGATLITAGVQPFQQFVAFVQEGFAQAIAAVQAGIATIVGEMAAFAGKVVTAVGDLSGALVSAGADLIRGLINGIKSMAGAALQAARDVASSVVGAVKGFLGINSPSKVFHDIGTDTVAGFTTGIGDNKDRAVAEAASMAKGVVDSAQQVIANGIDPLMVNIQLDPEALADLKKEKDLLDLQAKTLRVQKDQAPDKMAKAALQAQLDQINARKREISLIQEQTDYQKKYGEQVTATEEDYSSQISTMAKIPYDFANANVNQFLGDLGIGGNGALSAAAQWGLDFGSQFIFNVNGVGDAMAVKDRVTNQQAAGIVSR